MYSSSSVLRQVYPLLVSLALLAIGGPSGATESEPSHADRMLMMVKSTIVNRLIQNKLAIPGVYSNGIPDPIELALAYLEAEDSNEVLNEILLLTAYSIGVGSGESLSCIILEKGEKFKTLLSRSTPAYLRQTCLKDVAQELPKYELTKAQEESLKLRICLTEDEIASRKPDRLTALTEKRMCLDGDW